MHTHPNRLPVPLRATRPSTARRWLTMLALLCAVGPAVAWWDEAWGQRTRFSLDTSATGVAVPEALSNVPVALRLHSGNFDFAAAKPDGSDLRVLAADDKTPLPFRVERFDAANELAVLWVRLPSLLPGTAANTVLVYAGNQAAAAQAPAEVFDATTLLAVGFDDAANQAADRNGTLRATSAITPETNGLLAGGARVAGPVISWPAGAPLQVAAGGATTLSLWVRPDDIAAGRLLAWGPVQLAVQGGRVNASVAAVSMVGGDLAIGRWAHIALVLTGTQARLVVNGVEVGQAAVATPALEAELRAGEGLRGVIDQVEVAAVARSNAWLLAAYAAQGSDGKLTQSVLEDAKATGSEGGQGGYIGILVKNLSIDAWVVIVLLGMMFVVATVVMVAKMLYVSRVDRDNRLFLQRFRDAKSNLLNLEASPDQTHSSLYRLYRAGQRELKKRRIGEGDVPPLSGASLDAVKASVDADLVRESHKLNSQMVWLTIAISGGPFLGLMGTVIGVMITFAAIAIAGDVNVNAIAPGIAAALLTTVAGLAVAIPALFGYNYLASRIKNISSDKQIFVDEFITRVAEEYGAR